VATFRSKGWDGLRHGPVQIDDTIGCMLETVEGFPKTKARLVKDVLIAIGKYGQTNLPPEEKAKGLLLMTQYGMKVEDIAALYARYVGNWGGEATRWRFDGKRGGELIASQTRCPGSQLHLELTVSQTALTEGDCYDMAAVRIRVLDENGNLAPYAQLPLRLRASGAVALVGPELVTAEGGMTGAYVRTRGRTGKGSLTVETPQLGAVTVEFKVEKHK
jgi:beta-galactosidase